MRLGKTAAYGLFAAIYVANQGQGKPIQGRDIARAYNVPVEYLLKILQLLARGGILRSARGRSGGFVLARSASKITLHEIVTLLDPPNDPQKTLDAALRGHARTKAFLGLVHHKACSAARKTLEAVSLAQLCRIDQSEVDE